MRLTKTLTQWLLILGIKSSFLYSSGALAEDPTLVDLQTGSVIGRHIFGLSRDFQGDPVMLGNNPHIYSQESAFFDLKQGKSRFRVSLFDDNIAGVYVSSYSDKSASFIDTSALNMGAVHGAHSVGSAIKSPWDTVLFTESQVVNAYAADTFVKAMKPYFKNKNDLVKPYHYGWVNEVIILDEKGNTKAIKNYAAGRTFADSIVAMPDGKTFYLHDGGFSGNLYLFLAEETNSFAKGKLYVVDKGMNVKELGESSALKMKFKLKKATFDSFFKSVAVNEGRCKSGYKLVSSAYGVECLKPVKKNRKYVGQFEPIRQSAILEVEPFFHGEAGLSYNGNNIVIKLDQNDGVERRFRLKESPKLGTRYLISDEV